MDASRWPWRLPLATLIRPLDLEFGQVLAIAAHVPVAAPAQYDCP
jgi:hypothetical protein